MDDDRSLLDPVAMQRALRYRMTRRSLMRNTGIGVAGFSLASLRGPIGVTGPFTAPVLKPELQGATLRGGLAVALGVATGGIGALIPLLDFGSGKKDSNCAALMSQARQETGLKASDMLPRNTAAAAR